MAANATAVWRVRPSGNNNNGGGFDCSISAAATGTNGSFTGTTFTDATAAAFTAGMVGSSINISGIGQYKITARIDASNITLGSGNPGVVLTGGQAWTVGSGQDYSQQNAAQLSQSSTANTSTATTTLTDTGAAFTTAVIGNAIRVSGTGITTTYTFITARPSATTLTLQTSPGTTGSAVSYNIGGGWADFWTNCSSTAPTCVAGNTVYILGSGTPNPAAYTYDYTATISFIPFATTNSNRSTFVNDPGTSGYKPLPDTTGGMPVIKFNVANSIFAATTNASLMYAGLWFVGTTTAATKYVISGTSFHILVFGCVLDQFGWDLGLLTETGSGTITAIGCEVFSSVAAAAGSASGMIANNGWITVSGCNIHDCIGVGITTTNNQIPATIINTIVAKCGSNGMALTNYAGLLVQNCTIDGNLGHGITITAGSRACCMNIFNNIISNQTTAGKFGLISFDAEFSGLLIDYNVYYNNTADLSNLSYGPHDTHGGSNPYVGQTTENYTLV